MLHQDSIPSAFAVAVLAGGKSRRMGTDKAMLAWKSGGTLLGNALSIALSASQSVAICGAGRELAAAEAAIDHELAFPPPVLADPVSDSGPLAGVLSGCEWAFRSGIPVVVTLPVDCPYVQPVAIEQLAMQCTNNGLSAPCFAEGQFLLAAWPVHLAEYIHTALLRRQLAVQQLHLQLGSIAIPPDRLGMDPSDLVNINRPEEYEASS